MSSGKWNRKVDAGCPAGRAARCVLAERLEILEKRLADVLRAKCGNSEAVHQLRVASRRATAAVESFGVCLPHQQSRKLSSRVRSIRRAAGRIRDWDVLLLDLAQRVWQIGAEDAPGFDLLAGDSAARRSMAQEKFLKVCRKSQAPLRRRSKELVGAVSAADRRGLTFGDIGRFRLTALAERFFSQLGGPLADVTDYHALRLALKPLRYAVEIFSGCFVPALSEQISPQLETLQELLGGIQDCQLAAVRVRTRHSELEMENLPGWPRYDSSLRSLLGDLERTVAVRCEKVQQWREEQADPLRADLQRVLSESPLGESVPARRRNR
ncbi:MAG TPA: CHAD domain-containing protein [Planctomycetaceae bacterium]|nr:CHAD domain-containing protein [Planctomycetaceae bacterium]